MFALSIRIPSPEIDEVDDQPEQSPPFDYDAYRKLLSSICLPQEVPTETTTDNLEWRSAIYEVWMDNEEEDAIYRDLVSMMTKLDDDPVKRDFIASGVNLLQKAKYFVNNPSKGDEFSSLYSLF